MPLRPAKSPFITISVLFCLGGLLFLSACWKEKPAPKPAKPAVAVIAASKALDDTRTRLGFADAPSATCAACHHEKARSWRASLHHQTLLDAKKHPAKGDFSRSYFCEAQGVRFHIRGHHKERYVLKHPKGELHAQVSPCEWDVQKTCMKTGDLGEPPHWINDCAGCHTSRLNPKTGQRLEDGVACVMCHGPQSWHKAKKMATFNPGKKTETPRQSVEICAQCHTQGGYSPDGKRRYNDGYYPFMASLSGSYKIPFDHLREHGTGDPSKRLSYDHILYSFQTVVEGKTQTTCVSCHTLHPKGGGPPDWKKHSALAEEDVCKTCHVVAKNANGRRPALLYTPDCPVCTAKGECQ